MKKTLFLFSMLAFLGLSKNTNAQVSHLVISQVYGGGGNSGAVYKNDFIELFNPTSSPVSLSGWSVQYMSAASITAGGNITPLTGTIQPGAYYLVQEAAGAGGTTNLPTPDATGALNLSGTVGKVFLSTSTATLTAGCASALVVDMVGFGTTASCFEGAGATPAPTNTTSVSRANGGCTDTDNNSTDFTAGAPKPRNSSYAVSITAASNNSLVGSIFSYTIAASTAPLPTSFSITAGALPTGLSLDGVTGVISGTTTATGSFTAQITANNNCAKTAVGTFTFNVNTVTNNTVSFTGGANQTFTVCQDAAATSINSFLQINDADFGQTETYTITAQPSNGVVVMGSTALSNGSNVTPTGFTYMPNPLFNGTDMFTVQVDDGSGTPAVTTVTVTVNAAPTVMANTTNSVVCAGDMITLTASGTATTYTWSNSVVDGTPFTPTTNTYSVTGTDGNGCTAMASVAITVNALPTVQANTTNSVVCAGDMITLTGGGAATYTWTNSVVDGTPFTPTTNTYSVTGTDVNGCMGSASVAITVNNLPTVQATATSTMICAGDMTTLTGTGSATTYTWTDGVTDGAAFAPNGSDTYTVTGVDGNNCVATDMITVTVNNLPTVRATATATMICAGDMTTLTGTGTATTYTWTSSVVDGVAFAPTGSDTYTVTGVDGNNCVATDMITVTVNNLPTVQATATATMICAGDMTTLTGTGTATTYTWTSSVVDGVAFAPTGNDTYTVTGVDGNNCVATDMITVTVNSLPTTPNVIQTGDVLSSDVTGTSYQWYFNNAAITTDGTSATYTITGVGAYQVEVFNAQNCSAISAEYTVSTTGIARAASAKNVHIYPNPASSFITVEADANISLIEMYDISGKVIISATPSTNAYTIQLNNVEPGVYFLKTQKNNQISVQKIIVR